MDLKDAMKRKPEHAPVNPLTGRLNEPVADAEAAPPTARDAYWDADDPTASSPFAGGAPAASGAASSQAGEGPRFATAVPFADDAGAGQGAPAATMFGRLRRLLDNRIVSIVMLFVVLAVVVGIEHILLFLVLMFVGYVLIDRFVQVRRCVVLGGTAWLVVIIAGAVLAEYAQGPLVVGIDSFFTFCGFLMALAVCAAFFAGRAMYRIGFEHGQADADDIIAQHMVDRLIEHPDDWGQLDGDFLEVEGALNQVRERQRLAEQALRDEARRKDDLVTYLAHDLKTPLASVVGYLSLLEEAPDLPAEQRARFTGIALEKAHRLDALIEEFFDITRFDFHDIVLTRGYVDLNLMLAQVVDEFYPTLAEQRKEAVIDVPAGLTVLMDGDKMARVFNNVMKNAIAYSYDGSTIRVTAERVAAGPAPGVQQAGAVKICFENQGDPIPAPKLKVIFEKFYRLDAARATNRGGAGLGLAIAKEIVTAHGGTISCSSTPERTVFTIVLPG